MQFHHLLDYCVKQMGAGAQLKLQQINQGALNQNYSLKIDNRRYLVKQFIGNKWLPTKRKDLYTLQTRLSAAGLAAQPLHLSDNQKTYIEQWIEFEPLALNDSDPEPAIELLATSLHHIHKSKVEADILDLPKHFEKYLKYIKDPQRAWKKQAAKHIQVWQDYVSRYHFDFVLCHNDLHLQHIDPHRKIYFDWEYAGKGCRFFDLLTCILTNELNHEHSQLLIRRYIEIGDIHREEVLQRIKILQAIVIFLHQLWWQANETQAQKSASKQK
jgi:thiamine kinase-like enzyme